MSNLAILNTSIRQYDNLFSLTDLHRASGGLAKHKPVLFLSNQQTKDLVLEIENDKVENPTLAVKTVRGGRNPSTYVCKELVIAYAAWISPAFHLTVLRAFLNQAENQPQQLALPAPEKTFTVELTKDNIHDLVWLLYSHGQMNWLLGRLIKPLELIGSSFSPAVIGNHKEYQRHYRDCLPLIQQMVDPLKQADPQEWQRLQYRLNDN